MRRASRPTPEHRSLALFALTLGVFLVTLNVTVVIVALPSLQSDLGIGTDEAAWVIDAYNLVGASLLLSAGFLADRFGRKRMLCTGYSLFTIGAFACALAPGGTWLIVFRVRAGDRRHRAHADEPLDRRQPLSRTARARPRNRDLGHLLGCRHRARADRRRGTHRVAGLALGVRRQRPRRPRRSGDRPARRAPLAQRGRTADRRRRAAARDRILGDAHLRADRDASLRLRLHPHRRRVRARGGPVRGIHRRRAARPRAAGRPRLLPRPPVRGRDLPRPSRRSSRSAGSSTSTPSTFRTSAATPRSRRAC